MASPGTGLEGSATPNVTHQRWCAAFSGISHFEEKQGWLGTAGVVCVASCQNTCCWGHGAARGVRAALPILFVPGVDSPLRRTDGAHSSAARAEMLSAPPPPHLHTCMEPPPPLSPRPPPPASSGERSFTLQHGLGKCSSPATSGQGPHALLWIHPQHPYVTRPFPWGGVC